MAADECSAPVGRAGLAGLNIDPVALWVLAQMASAVEDERTTVQQQPSGACTKEVAAFDEFAALLAGDAADFDHVVFGTAPSGDTPRPLSLPAAWSGFLEANEAGASCLGPQSGLKMQGRRLRAAMEVLGDGETTAIILVARLERASLFEAACSAGEL